MQRSAATEMCITCSSRMAGTAGHSVNGKLRLPNDRQLGNSINDGVAKGKIVSVSGEPQVREPDEKLAEYNLQLDTGQRLAETLMQPESESDMPPGIAGNVKLVRIGKDLRIPVSSGDRGNHAFAGVDALSAHLDVIG